MASEMFCLLVLAIFVFLTDGYYSWKYELRGKPSMVGYFPFAFKKICSSKCDKFLVTAINDSNGIILTRTKELFLAALEDHKGIIYKVANSYCKEDAERDDLIQEISIQLWLSLENHDGRHKLSTWIYRVALNTSISYYRKNKTRKEKTTRLTPIIQNTISDEVKTDGNSEAMLLHTFIQELKEIDKALILLYLDELSYKEIAALMNISVSNVSTRISRIRKSLSQRFESLNTKKHEQH